LAFLHNGRPEPGSKVFWKFVKLRVAVDFDGLLGGIAYNIAVVAPSQMFFKFRFCGGVNHAVKVVG